MNNLSNYNEFKNTKKINEASKPFQTTHGAGSYNGGTDTFFANVHGNLAGAENTLVGGALIRMFGFVKRKGMEAYIKMRLKPELGRIYMNGVLRYAIKEGFIGPRKKEFFVIKKIENEEEVDFNNKVSFTHNGQTGTSCIVVGAVVKLEKPEPVLVDGQYICVANGVIFVVVNSTITEVLNGKNKEEGNVEEDTNNEDEEEVYVEPTEEEINKERDEYEKKLFDGTTDIEPDVTVQNDVKFLENTLEEIERNTTTNNNKISDDDKKFLDQWVIDLEKDIKLLKDDSVTIIDSLISKEENANKKLAFQTERQEYLANIKALIEIRDKIKVFLSKHKQGAEEGQKVAESIITQYNNFLLEKTAPVTVKDVNVGKLNKVSDVKVKTNKPVVNRLGDELQELSKNGETVDLNDENFYKQFESTEVKKAVSNEILTDSPKLVKIQLAAEKIINGGVVVYDRDGNKLPSNNLKLEAFWKKTVQEVLGMYSKFMIPAMVNPYTLEKQIPEGELSKLRDKNSEGDKLSGFIGTQSRLSNKKFSDSVERISKLKGSQNDYNILRLKFSDKEDGSLGTPYLVRKVSKDGDGLKVYRVYGKIDLDKITPEYKDKDFIGLCTNSYNKALLPNDFKDISSEGVFRAIKGIYIIANRSDNFSLGSSQNYVSILYLYKDFDGEPQWDKPNSGVAGQNWTFKIKNQTTSEAVDITKLDANVKSEDYKIPMRIIEPELYKITNTQLFIDNTLDKFKEYDILKAKNLLDNYYIKNIK